MKKYTGFLAILFIIAGISPLWLGSFVEILSDRLLIILIPSFIIAGILARYSEKGIAKTTSYMLLGMLSFMVFGIFFLTRFS